jgi:hypothetical protein
MFKLLTELGVFDDKDCIVASVLAEDEDESNQVEKNPPCFFGWLAAGTAEAAEEKLEDENKDAMVVLCLMIGLKGRN